jgi:hypothetical protein
MFRCTTLVGALAAIKYQKFRPTYCDSMDNTGRRTSNVGNVDATFRSFQAKVKVKIFHTTAHLTLVGILHDYCDLLVRGRYVNSNGSHARLLQGAKGIGKSTVLSAFADVCSVDYPNVIPIYLTFNDLDCKNNPLERFTIMEIIIQKLKENGFVSDGEKVESNRDVIRVLEKKNKFILLLIDELEHLYRVSSPKLTELGHYDLGDLNWLGDQKSGRVVVLLCGSSANCSLLITCHGEEKEFPLQRGAPHLNDTKYKTERIPTEPFVNLQQIPNVIEGNEKIVDIKLSRLIAFSIGIKPRAVKDLMKELEKNNFDKDNYQIWRSTHRETGLKLVSSDSYTLYHEIMRRLSEKNKALFDSLLVNNELTVEKIMNEEWEKQFLPLDQEDVVNAWEAIRIDNKDHGSFNQAQLQLSLFELSDRDQLTFVGIKNGLPSMIYPMNLSQVFI